MLTLMIVAFILGIIFAAGLTTYDEAKAEIEINASADDVWNSLTDFSKYADWNTFITRVDSEFKEGATSKVSIALPFSKSMDFNLKVANIIDGQSFVWIGTTLERYVLDGVHTFQIEPVGANKVKFSQKEKFSGILLYLVIPFIKGTVEKNFRKMNQTLKNRVEGIAHRETPDVNSSTGLPSGSA